LTVPFLDNTVYVVDNYHGRIRAVGTGRDLTWPPTVLPTAQPTAQPTTWSPGTCVHASSTVTTLTIDGSHRALTVSTLKPGFRVLAVNGKREQVFAEVMALPHSASTEGFVTITMEPVLAGASAKHQVKATLHHTFPSCGSDEPIQAMDLKPGDCLHTTTGKGLIASVERVPVKEGDMTYTIELKDANLVAVGGIFTHAKMIASTPAPLIKDDPSRAAALKNKLIVDTIKRVSALQALKRESTTSLLRKEA
jgi:hypothetical protein